MAGAVADQQAYLQEMDALVTAYVADLGDRKAELSDPAKAQAHCTAIQTLAEARFPDRTLGYLVGYGVYGLVNSKL